MSKQTETLKLALESAAGLALEVMKKHRQMKGEYPMGMLGARAVEEIEAVFREMDEALAERCVCGEPDTPGTHRTDGPCLAEQSAEIPQSITCPFCESQHVPGWLHDYNMDRMKKPAPAQEYVGGSLATPFGYVQPAQQQYASKAEQDLYEDEDEQPAQQQAYEQANPLGGPAKVFDAMADAIRAGDDYHAVLRQYGYAEAQQQEPVTWGVEWGKAGDIPCVCIIKRLPNGEFEVVAVEYAPYSYTSPPASKPEDK